MTDHTPVGNHCFVKMNRLKRFRRVHAKWLEVDFLTEVPAVLTVLR